MPRQACARAPAQHRRRRSIPIVEKARSAGAAPLFLLSFRQRDELARMVERIGWSPVAARRADAAERRFLASAAAVALVDARERTSDALAVVRALSEAAQANGAAILILLARRDMAQIVAAYEAGATHYLAGPLAEAELAQALRFAARHAERIAGGHRAAARDRPTPTDPMEWHWHALRPHRIALSPALAVAAGLGGAAQGIARGAAARLIGPAGSRAALGAIARVRRGEPIAPFAHEWGGEGRRLAHRVVPADGDAEGVTGQVDPLDGVRDPTAPRDALTGLEDAHGARRWIEARLAAAGDPLLILLGLSRFDMVNAAFGRGVGDTIIRAVGRRIERTAGMGAGGQGTARRCLVARLAGAEFAVGLPHPATIDQAEALAAELIAAIGRPFVAGDHVVTVTARIGIAAARGSEGAADLLRHASLALADAREEDAARVRVFEAGEETRRADDRRLELDLRLALDEDRIDILWQPQVSIASGRIRGVEALARWRHPVLGELGADALFAAAERSNYLAELSAHVQEKAIAIAARWEGALGALRVSVNVTAADIGDPGFANAMLARIDGAGIARRRVTLEVTETGLIADLGAAAGLLASLRAAGLMVAIDDFGTGYSSLAYLKALPLDTIKIDRRLAQDIAGSARDRIVVRSVIDMARSLGLAVVAEGVETEEQLALLAREGCQYYQGYLCSAPVDEAALAALVGRG